MTTVESAQPSPDGTIAFAYDAQTLDGRAMRGTIDANDLDEAHHQLQTMGLRVLAMEPVETAPAPKRGELRADDFRAFNDQLAHLAAAGLPVERGLKLLARDLRHGKLAGVVRALADEIDRGTPLPDAVAKYQDQFPPLYAKLIEAGIRTGDLSGTLLSLGRHVDTVQRLRANLWRAISYPLLVTVAFLIVLLFLSLVVLPRFEESFSDFGFGRHRPPPGGFLSNRWRGFTSPSDVLPLPWATQVLFWLGAAVPWIIGGGLLLAVAIPFVWNVMRRGGTNASFTDVVLLRLPVVGRALKMSLLARWCDALLVGVRAGLDLPSALRLAGDTIGSPALRRDSVILAEAVERGLPLESVGRTAMLPAVVPPMIELASRSNDLPAAMETLSNMYQQQADTRVRSIPMILTPVLMVIIALLIGLVIAGLMMPMVRLMQWISG